MTEILQTLLRLLEVALLVYFGLVVLYNLVFSIAGHFYTPSTKSRTDLFNQIAVLIPGYKEDAVIVDVARKAREQDYPGECYDVVIIADSFQPETLAKLRKLDIKVLEVSFEKSTKVKSLKKALNSLEGFDIAVILDADNVMDQGFLQKINALFLQGFKAIQGRRVAKNKNNDYAILDGLSEYINNHIYRRGSSAFGLSTAIIGSGMAFEYDLLKGIMNASEAVGGFDKELQLEVIKGGNRIYFLDDGQVYDEKVDHPEVLMNQRKRWMSSHYLYLGRYFPEGFKALLRGNFSYFNIAVLASIQLPRLFNMALLGLLGILAWIFQPYLMIPFYTWFILLLLYMFCMFISLPSSFYTWGSMKAVLRLPRVFLLMLLAHRKLRGSNKSFIHTPHKQH